jgi:prefoldin subunit 2
MTSPEINEREIVAHFNNLRTDLQRMASKIMELETDRDEHELVVKAMEPQEPSRKAFRLIHGVLVESTVEKVLPELRSNVENVLI